MEHVTSLIEDWSKNRGLDKADPRAQFIKVAEEFGEIASALAKNKQEELKDAIGDLYVTIVILAQKSGMQIEDCAWQAYNVIKSREGRMIDGIFVKSEDLPENMEG
jgi:NTP pyrophosphatase (non-canonical NTP hydrolase)